ncbi:MAG TPA: response regulator [Pyrinomonadaceae bacterium]|nr:response regulator [Pyrinomonadaceae bacterium]
MRATNTPPVIVVVEDDDDSRLMMKTLLAMKGYAVVEARNGLEAVRAVERQCPLLILMDLGLPLMDGLDAARVMRNHAHLRDVPIIALSGHATDEYEEAAFAAGYTGYLTKPLDFDLLERLLAGL